jgi:hypothetical protein
VQFYLQEGRRVPEVHGPLEVFRDQHKGIIPALRAKHWNGKHPDRWTGNSLPVDCRTADELEPARIPAQLGMGLNEFYETQIRRINWSIHGKGFDVPLDSTKRGVAFFDRGAGYMVDRGLRGRMLTYHEYSLEMNSWGLSDY